MPPRRLPDRGAPALRGRTNMRAPTPHLDLLLNDAALRALAERLAGGAHASAVGASGSSTALGAAAIARLTRRAVVLVVAHLDDADEAVDELTAAGVQCSRLPALEFLPGETSVSLELFAERLSLVRRIASGRLPEVIACPIQALMQAVPDPSRIERLITTVRPRERRPLATLTRWLDAAGYKRIDSIEDPGDFAVRGGIVDIFPASGPPVRLDFFGDEIESITEIDLETMGSGLKLEEAELIGARLAESAERDSEATGSLIELLPEGTLSLLSETIEITEQGRGYYERVHDSRGIFGPPAVFKTLRERTHAVAEISQFSAASASSVMLSLPVRPLPELPRDASEAIAELGKMASDHRVIVFCQNEGELSRLHELTAEFAPGASIEGLACYLHRGFIWGDESAPRPMACVPYHELLHRYNTRRRIRRLKAGRATDAFLEINIGDYVVHTDHGVARFIGLKTMKPMAPKPTADQRAEDRLAARPRARGAEKGGRAADSPSLAEEYLVLEFAGRSRLNVPVSQIDKVQRYIGGFSGKPPLSTLGGKRWEGQKERVRESVRDLAGELLRIQAARESMPGIRFPDDTAWQREFEAEFPYEETDDQLAAMVEIKKDMTRPRPMDRLLCGDVGYGKTELAIRAAFKAVEFGKQAAVLVPTTLLAEQHERTFRQRFADYPFRIESLSRFKSTKQQNDVLAATRKGQVDVLIGTHRILSKDVKFADLGVVIVDEEQRFGVEHKNALLALRLTVDVLTLSATPIPRTLHMAMLGLRDISSLSTPPLDRRAVVTEVIPYNEKRVQQAIRRELAREGQVYFVHNRVHNIRSVADDLQRLAPDARIIIGHGQMPDDELEEVMRKFVNREADILVSTTIIESGIDIPTANTMFINNADRFGLADLHQLRGRVGRYKHRAYCYLLLPADRPVTDIASRRLRAIEEFSMLGAGFKIAMRDLEIRGAGNLLGAEQSGHIAAVGYDMYCRLMEQAARELKHEQTGEPADTTIEIGVSGSFPKSYIPSESRRLEAYRRVGAARTHEELSKIEQDLKHAYGEPPAGVVTALDLARLRVAAMTMGVRSIALHEQDVIFRCRSSDSVDRVVAALQGVQGTVRPLSKKPGDTMQEVYFRPPTAYLEPGTLLTVLRRRLSPTPAEHPTDKALPRTQAPP
ncbi:MAG: transcription-repair coupling factor [Phycisphaerae bacterium]|nr:transcription-repair coupling factor [Phycisphaerae bacterium]